MGKDRIIRDSIASLAALAGLLTVHEVYSMSHIKGNITNASSMMARNMTAG